MGPCLVQAACLGLAATHQESLFPVVPHTGDLAADGLCCHLTEAL